MYEVKLPSDSISTDNYLLSLHRYMSFYLFFSSLNQIEYLNKMILICCTSYCMNMFVQLNKQVYLNLVHTTNSMIKKYIKTVKPEVEN